jgi:hypothetical protein
VKRLGLLALGLALAGCGPSQEGAVCRHEGEEVYPDESVESATRVGDLLEPYFGRQQGTLSWATGSSTRVTFDFPYEAGAPYRLSNIYECEARNVGYQSNSHVTTEDGSFDDEIVAGFHVKFPAAPHGAEQETVIYLSALADWQWSSTLPERLGIDLERYESASVHFELDWPPETPAPSGGRLLFYGTLALDSRTQDTVQVGTLSF